MKTLFLLTAMLFTFNSLNAQLTTDYPFKTYLDSANNLNVTGFGFNNTTNSLDITYEKYDNEGNTFRYEYYPNSFGSDRGMDITFDNNGNSYITGFIFNTKTQSNDIIILKYNSLGILVWDKILEYNGDDKSYAIEINIDNTGGANEIFIAGYKTSPITQRNIFVSKLNGFGDTLWQHEIPASGKYSVATDIKVDAGFVYVCGYGYMGPENGDDIIMVTMDRQTGEVVENGMLVHNIAGSNERPTAFSLVNRSDNILSKSRSVVTSISDNFNQNSYPSTRFRTVFYNEDVNHNLSIRWQKEFFNRGLNDKNVPTALTVDQNENIYVTGYTRSTIPANGLDFVTMVYKPELGEMGWNGQPIYYNNDSIVSPTYNDKASSIKIWRDGSIFVAGVSDASPYGYSVRSYKQETVSDPPIIKWTKTFKPNFNDVTISAETETQRWASLEVDTEGQPILIAMEWNGSNAQWKARKFDTEGNVIFTIGEEDNSDLNSNAKANTTSDLKRSDSDNDISKTQLLQNKPNPFNPSTEIFYNVAQNGFVNIKVYNLLGQEVAALVNEMKQPGNYQIRFDGSALSSGMYFYKMFVNENLIDGKRMLLLK
ncbi:MAG: SBBP repeat-containing protein [Ignavibacteria bacterium]